MQVYCKPFCDRHTRVPFHNVKKRFRRSLNPIATLIAQSPRLSFSLIAPAFLFTPSFFYHLPRHLTQQLFRALAARCQRFHLCALLSAFELFAEAERKISKHEHKADGCDRTGIGNEVREGVAERRADDNVGRIAAHGCRAAEVGAENFGQDHRHRIKFHRLRQFKRNGGEEEHDGDAVDKHRKQRRERHKADQQRHDTVMYEPCERQAQPAKKARLAKPLDHDHHTGDENDRGPVDADRAFLTRAIPEGALKKSP